MSASNKNPRGQSRGKSAESFNEQSGSHTQKAGGDITTISKAQVLAQLKQQIPFMKGNTVKTQDGDELCPTANQNNLMKNIAAKPVNFVEGTFGTGKTLWTCYMALKGMTEKRYTRICLNAPAVEAGENIGFLKGSADEKMLPHVNQILEAFDEFIGEDLRKKMQETGLIKIEPHAFLRGRSLKKTFFIFDECQNATGPNLQTALTRLGNDSTFVFMGDSAQNDRTVDEPAFTAFINRYTKPVYNEYTAHSKLQTEDVRRHPFLKLVVEQGDHAPLQGHENTPPPTSNYRKAGVGVAVCAWFPRRNKPP